MEPPKVSVVIASHNAATVIADCLASLQAQQGREVVEIIVADSSSDGTPDLVRERFPDIRLLRFPEPLAIPHLRGAGIAEARGEIIAILDPYCILTDGWLPELLKMHAERPEPVIGGAVDLDHASERTLVNWATYLSEYWAFVPPLEAGAAAELTGNNIAYKRRALGEIDALRRTGFWKTFVNWRLRSEGHQLWTAPSVVVHLRKPIPFAAFFRSRYHHGRCFAAMRVAHAPRLTRWLRALTVPVLPYLALWRQTRSLWPKRRYRAKFLMAVPLLFLFHSNWAWGELWGYLRGPGRSCSQMVF
jgi:GT2 family glycosyltransferase